MQNSFNNLITTPSLNTASLLQEEPVTNPLTLLFSQSESSTRNLFPPNRLVDSPLETSDSYTLVSPNPKDSQNDTFVGLALFIFFELLRK